MPLKASLTYNQHQFRRSIRKWTIISKAFCQRKEVSTRACMKALWTHSHRGPISLTPRRSKKSFIQPKPNRNSSWISSLTAIVQNLNLVQQCQVMMRNMFKTSSRLSCELKCNFSSGLRSSSRALWTSFKAIPARHRSRTSLRPQSQTLILKKIGLNMKAAKILPLQNQLWVAPKMLRSTIPRPTWCVCCANKKASSRWQVGWFHISSICMFTPVARFGPTKCSISMMARS